MQELTVPLFTFSFKNEKINNIFTLNDLNFRNDYTFNIISMEIRTILFSNGSLRSVENEFENKNPKIIFLETH